MDVLKAIRTRRTVKQFRPEPVPRELIEQALDAAVWAPNHRLTEPWSFLVVQGPALQRLAELRRRMTAEFLESQGAKPDVIAKQGQEAYEKAMAAPVTVAVTMAQHADPAVREEDYASTMVAVQNLMLAAHALGFASFLSTNRLLDYPPARELLSIPVDHRLVGLVQLGYAAQQRESRRTPAADRTRWLEA